MRFDFSNVVVHDGREGMEDEKSHWIATSAGRLPSSPTRNDEKSKTFLMQAMAPRREVFGVQTISYDDYEYPDSLRKIKGAPRQLYAIGDISLLKQRAIAMVGTRRPSIYGVNQAEKFAYEIAKSEYVIVSGMARGIDTASHKGALKASGKTIAVLGCGVDICYPPENDELKAIIEKNGLVISPFPLGSSPQPKNFPIRNNIISGLSEGVLVVECSERSGTFSTVSAAEKQGKSVWTLPTNLDNKSGRGNLELIKKGVGIAFGAGDIIQLGVRSEELGVGKEEERGFIKFFHESEAIGLEELMDRSGMGISEINGKLLELELEGKIKALAGKNYVLVSK